MFYEYDAKKALDWREHSTGDLIFWGGMTALSSFVATYGCVDLVRHLMIGEGQYNSMLPLFSGPALINLGFTFMFAEDVAMITSREKNEKTLEEKVID